jgi:Zn-dependent alcohol dehydrogenase
MKAAVCREFGKPLSIEHVEIDSPQRGEVKVRIKACAICHSDVHCVRGDWGYQAPLVAGHEAAGVVTEVGDDVGELRTGDRVVVTLMRSCGCCFQCRRGKSNLCETGFALDRETRLRSRTGESIFQGIKTGAFAEYAVVHQSQLVKMPEGMPFETASLLACGVITGVGAVVNTARVETGSTVAVIGGGGVGLNCIQGAVLSGASRIVGIDLRADKLEACRRFGATDTINAAECDPVENVKQITGGVGLDYAFVAVGSAKAANQASGMIRPGGTVVIVGMPANDDVTVTLNAHDLSMDRTIRGSLMGSTRLATDVPRLIDLYRNGRLKLDELISGRFGLEDINAALDGTERGEALRNVILFE